ncbi:MAG: hypothetical protein EA425_14790 [Puniceicoccaceae bacterium]|nr:MAG: hypothetical protein EA425_14790 [Puniceicoccaceae bacterium]
MSPNPAHWKTDSVNFRIAIYTLLLAVALHLSGGYWAALQGVAWMKMIVDYSAAEGSLGRGLSATFGGENPCDLCRAIQEGREQERQREADTALETHFRHLPMPAAATLWLRPPTLPVIYPGTTDLRPPQRLHAPPGPVPRAGLLPA